MGVQLLEFELRTGLIFFIGLYVKALGSGVDEILCGYRQKLLQIEEEVIIM